MRTYFLNPGIGKGSKYIREGRCMQRASSLMAVWPPITLAVLAAIAKRKGAVRLIDANIEVKAARGLIKDVEKFAPDLITVNSGFPSIDDDMAAVKNIKELFPNIKILTFGLYFTLLEKQGLLDYPFLDFAIVGEPEETFREFLDNFNEKTKDYNSIKGLAYRDFSGVKVNPKRPFISEIDKIPFPEINLLKAEKYRLPHNNKTFTLINTARGCPYQCAYCAASLYYGKKKRGHSVDYIIEEIKRRVYEHNIHEFFFWEEVFTLDRSYVLRLCEAILKNNLSIKWAATTRVDLLDDEILKAMKRSGCYLLGLGIESAHQKILDNVKKGQLTIDAVRAVGLCKKHGIKTMGHFIFGLPGENKETADKTIKFMLKLGLDYMQSYCAVPYPKTELGEMSKRKKMIWADKWNQYDIGGRSILNTNTLSPEEVSSFRKKAFRKFYFRPLFIFKNLREIGFFRALKLLKFTDWMNFKK